MLSNVASAKLKLFFPTLPDLAITHLVIRATVYRGTWSELSLGQFFTH